MGRLPAKIYVDFSKDIIYFGLKSRFGVAYGQNMTSPLAKYIMPLRDFEKIRFLALRSRAFGNVRKMELERFWELEEVICIAEHDFELGKEPLLRREEFGEALRHDLTLSRQMTELLMGFRKKKDEEPEWKMPATKKGYFDRGRANMS